MPQILRSSPIDINPKFLHVGYSSSEQHQFNDQLSTSSDVSSDDGAAIDFYYASTSQSQLFYPPSSPTSPSSPSFSSNWIQEIVEACRVGDEYLVNQLLEEMIQARAQMKKEEFIKTYNINALERTTKRAAIHWCMAGNHVNILLSLLTTFSSVGADIVLDVNLREQKSGATPLHVAIANNSMDCMLLFLNTNFVFSRLEREAKDVYGNTFFHVAYRLRRFEVMDKLIEIFGNEVINSKKTSSETCMHIAAKKSDSKGLNWLIKRGAKIQAKDENGRRPLISSIYNYRESCNSEGLINGHNNLPTPHSPNTQIQIGQSIHGADSKEEATCTKSKKRKSDDNSSGKKTSEDMDFPPEITNRMKRSLCYCILIQKEVELMCGGSIKKWIKNESECPEGINIFHQAALNGNKELLSVCSLLMDRNYYNQLIEKKDKRKYNILHFACEGGHFPVLELLSNQLQEMYPNTDQLKQIYNAKDSTPLQETPVHKAARRMESLMEFKTNNEITPEKESAIECMTFLMYSNYTEMNLKNTNGETPNDILQRCGFFSSQLFLYNKKNKV
ncbi:predicted protein [Naegleria gruberi]|uniref:Predicted protein n=1 Tax=Naegleria gruberi TaxID=5762 RepID=D2V800_NAEGR|nr:uncharacterized protein NAEGRDRAFT_64981 [Naegleria gruberi]EFC47094.1 predicted protein [Naegleria gruberi]|eukprot:XP_002679838.1 predicted protein [Naegleria gruberi strain NEG-M]